MKLPGLKNPVCYLCAEFAIDNELPTYSGGLGILAGDIMHEAALAHFPMVGIGILYKGEAFLQHITKQGKEEKRDSQFDHDASFLRPTTIDGKILKFKLNFESYQVDVKSYHIRLSDNTILFFLSTDLDGNPLDWRSDMEALYRGDTNGQIRQQILLGVGGVRLLKKLKIKPKTYHINEGRPEFIIWELTENIMSESNLPFEEAWNKAKEKIVYTNHTLVSAGNLTYPVGDIEKWASPFAKKMGINTDLLIRDGLSDQATFNTTLFALNISKKHSAVSKVHGELSKKEWPNFEWVSITNGVNMARWQDSDYRNPSLTDQEIWELHMAKKRELVETVRERTGFEYDSQRLVVSWARRLAEYKQPRIIFQDLDRLKNIVSNSQRPIQILFAGNSHSADPNAESIIGNIISIFSDKLSGHAIFIPNYNISLANHLVSGSDVWLNTPKGNLEASGTSGIKACSNGCLNCTVIDGWTNEVDWEGVGWTLDPNNVADSFYYYLENDIAPLYYERNNKGLPAGWIERMRKSISVAANFTTERVLEEYKKILYS